METRRLYYEDCQLREFTARVLDCVQTEKGYEILLDATAFYPEGGGQACDTGTLGPVRVLETRERGEAVIHLCDGPLTVGQQVKGSIDWESRFDRMQQHTGEHILSGLIHAKYGYHNVGFHMGKDTVEVDFDGPIDPAGLAELERLANEAVWRDIPLKCWVPSEEELPGVVYRSKRALPWPVRIVQVPGYDSCACCGVHTASTGQVGIIKVFSCVKFHQGVRIEMLCGRKAYEYLCCLQEQNKQVSQAFSAKPLETGTAAQQVKDQLAQEKFRYTGLWKRYLEAVAQSAPGSRLALQMEKNLTSSQIRELADALAREAAIAAVCSGSDEEGYRFCIVSTKEDIRPLGKALLQAFDGRGGGRADAFQGNLPASREEILVFFRKQ